MLFGGKKERETEGLIKKHLETVGEVIQALHATASDYCCASESFEERAAAVMKGESEADDIRRNVEQSLYDGAFMPIERGDYARLVEQIDKVANQCEAVAQFLLLTRPDCTAEVNQGISDIMDATVRCFGHVIKMFDAFDDGQAVVSLTHETEEEERNVDEIYARVVSELFASDVDLARKLHIKLLLDRIAAISNRIEDTGDIFSIIVSRRPR